VPFYYFLHISIPPFMGIIHSAKTVYSETVYTENPISIDMQQHECTLTDPCAHLTHITDQMSVGGKSSP